MPTSLRSGIRIPDLASDIADTTSGRVNPSRRRRSIRLRHVAMRLAHVAMAGGGGSRLVHD